MTVPLATMLLAGLVGLVFATALGRWAAQSGFPLPDERRRLGAIDGLRGYLSLLVMVHHFASYLLIADRGGPWRDSPEAVLQSFGAGSVTLFFMITGALFFPKTWNGIGGNDWRAMYISRAFRILPLQALMVLVVAAIALARVDFRVGDSWIGFVPRILLWLSSYSQPKLFGYAGSAQVDAYVLWSLWAEWKFYIIALPLIAVVMSVLGGRRGRWAVPLALLAGGIACRFAGDAGWQRLNYSVFACGMLGLLARSSRIAPLLASAPMAIVASLGVAAAAMLAPVPDYPVPLACYAVFFACVIAGNPFGGLLATRGALVLGEASFSIYLLHGVMLNLLFVSGSAWVTALPSAWRPWLLVLAIPAIGGVAIVTYLLIERPMIRAGRRLAQRWRRPPRSSGDVSSEVVAP